MCISYIENEEPLEARTDNLYEYQFVCRCQKCVAERGDDDNDDGTSKGKRKAGTECVASGADAKKRGCCVRVECKEAPDAA